ncbi:hypothetical protein HY992_01730 [Candidatus Micrarchaeota archaeon]|nr:hypothetical protein [Candidatus Micrarchaeota archaeon]
MGAGPEGAMKRAEESKLRGKRPVRVEYKQPLLSQAVRDVAGLILVGGNYQEGETPVRGVRRSGREGSLDCVSDPARRQASFTFVVSSVALALASSGRQELRDASLDVLHGLSSIESADANVSFMLSRGSKGTFVLEVTLFGKTASSGWRESPISQQAEGEAASPIESRETESPSAPEARDCSYSIHFKLNANNTLSVTSFKDEYAH